MPGRANIELVTRTAKYVVIRDVGPWDKHPTVTNDAEGVVQRMAAVLDGRRLLYFDSEGRLDELVVRDGKFAWFAPGPPDGKVPNV